MSKVLLLNPPGKYLYLRDQYCSGISKASYYWPPLDLVILSGILSQEHDIQVIDAIIEKMDEEECLKRINNFQPDSVVFLSGLASRRGDLAFMERIKELTGASLIASGDIFLHDCRKQMEQYPFLDAILLDFSSAAVLAFLRGEEAASDICYRQGREIIYKPRQKLKEFRIPVPRHELFPLRKYRLPHARYRPFTSMMTNYGCPYHCGFCVAEKLDFKYRPIDNVLPELQKINDLGIREIFLKDFTFGVPAEVARGFCQEISKNFPKLSWICSSRVNVMNEEMLVLMKKAGCHTVQFGVESARQDILDDNEKQITQEQIKSTFALCKRLGIRTLAHFILGLPGETEESCRETIQLAKNIDCDFASFNIAIPLPGTTLEKRCHENNWLKGDLVEMDASVSFPVIDTPFLSNESLWQLRNKAISSFYFRPSYICKKIAGIRSPHDFLNLCEEGLALFSTIK